MSFLCRNLGHKDRALAPKFPVSGQMASGLRVQSSLLPPLLTLLKTETLLLLLLLFFEFPRKTFFESKYLCKKVVLIFSMSPVTYFLLVIFQKYINTFIVCLYHFELRVDIPASSGGFNFYQQQRFKLWQ